MERKQSVSEMTGGISIPITSIKFNSDKKTSPLYGVNCTLVLWERRGNRQGPLPLVRCNDETKSIGTFSTQNGNRLALNLADFLVKAT